MPPRAASTTSPLTPVSITIERRTLNNRWASHQWRAVRAELSDKPRGPVESQVDESCTEWTYGGMEFTLFRDEAEGYFLNVSADTPQLFVMWRIDDESSLAVPRVITASYNEAGRLLDGGETVEGVPMPPALLEAVQAYVAQHYKPEPKQRKRPQSFKRLDERAKIV